MDLSCRFLDPVLSERVGGVTVFGRVFFLRASDPKIRSRSQQRMMSLLSSIVCRVDNDPEQLPNTSAPDGRRETEEGERGHRGAAVFSLSASLSQR